MMNLFKRIFVIFTVLSLLNLPAFAQEAQYDGYIVKYKNREDFVVLEEAPLALFGGESNIEYIVPDFQLEFLGTTPGDPYYKNGTQWNLSAMKAEAMWEIDCYGDNVKIAVIDSGVTDFGELTHCLLPGMDCVTDAENPQDTTDMTGHGTFISGIIAAAWNDLGVAGIAQNAKIVPLRCFKEVDGVYGAPTSAILRAIKAAVDTYDCKVINISMGIGENVIKNYPEIITLYEKAVNYAYDKGAIIVAAAGNDGVEELMYPAALEKVIGVGAVYKNAKGEIVHAPYSQVNESVFVVAPGGYVERDEQGEAVYSNLIPSIARNSDSVIGNIGTSFSTPAVSALAALALCVKPSLSNGKFAVALRLSSDDLGDSGYDTTYGYGLVNAENLRNLLLERKKVFASPLRTAENDSSATTLYNFTSEDMSVKFVKFTKDKSGKLSGIDIFTETVEGNKSKVVTFAASGEGKLAIWTGDTLSPVSDILSY